jgi:uncharacterized integral membrane protein
MSSDPSERPTQHPPLPAEDLPAGAGDEPAPAEHAHADADSGLTRTRAAAMWSALAGGFLVLIVLLIFIAQNTESARFQFLGWHWSLPLGVAILGAAVCGGLLTVAVGTARMYQLRRAARKNARTRSQR